MPKQPKEVRNAPSAQPERLGGHAEMVAILDRELAAERAALHEAIIDTLSDRADDGTPRWSHEQILEALEPLVAGQRRPSTPRRRPLDMKGQNTFTIAQAQEIRDHLVTLKQARDAGDRPLAKTVRGWLREIGFYISDWKKPRHVFHRTDFDQLVHHGLIEITETHHPRPEISSASEIIA
jgi:hypothetical protein